MSQFNLEQFYAETLEGLRQGKIHRRQAVPHVPFWKGGVSVTGYAPHTWRQGRCVELLCRLDDGQLQSLGKFQEYFHSRPQARRLTRLPQDGQGSPAEFTETVCGSYWLEANPGPGKPVDSAEDIREIHRIFYQLIAQGRLY